MNKKYAVYVNGTLATRTLTYHKALKIKEQFKDKDVDIRLERPCTNCGESLK